jgi:hypothetical protein
MTRSKLQLVRDRVRLQNQLEALLEETRIKLSSVISDLFVLSGLARPIRSSWRSWATTGSSSARKNWWMHLQILQLYLERLKLLDRHVETRRHRPR